MDEGMHGPVRGKGGNRPVLHAVAGGPGTDPGKAGAAAWILDETELAVRLLREALARLRAPGVRGASGAVLSALEWACIDSGRWDEALAAAREASDIAAAYKMETVAASADLATATVLAMRGDHDQVGPLLASALAAVDEAEYRAFAARARHAAGLAALAEGDYVTAYAQLSQLFDADGTPLHHHVSYLGVADLAAAAVRAERHLEAELWSVRWPGWTRPRAAAGAARGPRPRAARRARGRRGPLRTALAVTRGDAGRSSGPSCSSTTANGCGGSGGSTTPSPSSPRPCETFRRLGAAPWTRRAEAELRACGVAAQAAATVPDALAGLTAQQREIVILASRGLTNGEIADRLFLSRARSPRTCTAPTPSSA